MTQTHARPRRAPAATPAAPFLPLFLAWLAVSSPGPAEAALPKVPEGFKIRLVAAVPAVQYPCQVATAPDGSLFVAEDPMDQVGPANKPGDRVLLFREGKEPVVFAETLNAVFGMVWHRGALYVMNMPCLTVLRDTDGDGRADEREELFTDLGVPAGQPNMFNDHIVSGIQIGIDGYLYISVGDKGVPKATGPDGRSAQVFGGGVLRCRLDGSGLEVFTHGTRNHLEPNLDARDNLFTYDNTDDGLGWWTRVTHHVDGAYFGYPWDYHDRTDRMLDRMAEYGGGSPCGGLVYKEDAWPEKYRGRAFWAEWGKRTVRAFAFAPEGASFKVADVEDFIQPDEVSDFRPLDLALSDDGKTLYVADWGYGGWNNKTEKLGRVYAVTYEGEAPPPSRPRGKDSDPVDAQIRALDHPSFNERSRAQWVLAGAGRPALAAVAGALATPKTDPLAKRHLVWAVDAIAGGTPEATGPLVAALNDGAADVRAQAARALGERGVKEAAAPLAAKLADPEPAVRLQAVIALGRVGESASVAALLPVLGDPDPYLSHSARRAVRRINDWKAAAAGLGSADPKVRLGVLRAMEMAFETDAASSLAGFAADASRDPGERARAVFLMAQGHRKPVPWDGKWWGTQPAKTKPPAKSVDWPGTAFVLAAVRERLSDPVAAVRLEAVKAVRETGDPAALPVLRGAFGSEADVPVRREIARVLGALGDKEALPMLVAAVRDADAPGPVRDAALESVEAIGNDDALKALLALIDEDTLGPDKLPRVVSSLGRFKKEEAVKALVKAAGNASPAVRAAAAESLGKSGRRVEAAGPLRNLLDDPAVEVRKSAIAALGTLKDKESVPSLLKAADASETGFEASMALAATPDPRALSVYLRGLTDKSPDLRKASSTALGSIRDAAAPVLEQLAARKELSPNALPELRKIYTRTRPVMDWRMLGAFPIKETPVDPAAPGVDLGAKFPGYADEPLEWRRVRASNGRGEVDLGRVFHKNDDGIAALAYAELDSATDRKAELAVGSDDTLTVWVNGEKAFDFQDNRAFSPDENRVDVPLVKGKNRILLKCGNRGGDWRFSLAVGNPSDYAFLKGPAPGSFDPEAFRKFALARKGNPEHGKALFADPKGLACLRCHAVGGEGGSVGPELTSVGAKYPKDELISSVIFPSAKISSGYEPVVIATADGRVITGIVKGETPEAVELEDAEAKRLRVPKGEIDERKRSDVSIMPNGLADGLTRDDFADLIAYLETLRDKEVGRPSPAAPEVRPEP